LAPVVTDTNSELCRTHKSNRNFADGKLTDKFTLDELLNNVMLYWLTGSITSSMRFYAENVGSNHDFIQVFFARNFRILHPSFLHKDVETVRFGSREIE
jgi:hypothetical protein